MNKSNLKEGLKKFRKRLDGRYVIEGEYSPDTSVGNADIAKSLLTKRIISDADVACPPITYGIAGGEAEIETGYQKVVKLMGNTVVVDGVVKSAKSAKLVSRGKNQFTAFDEFIDVVGGMQILFVGTGTFHITEYASDRETILVDLDRDENDAIDLDENTRYIKIHSTEDFPRPNPMMYYTFGEVYNEEYEKPVVSELELPNVELLSAGTAKDVLYSDGRLERNIVKEELSDVTATMASSSVHTTIVLDIIAKKPITDDTLPNIILDGYQRAKWNDYLNSRLPAGKYILISPQNGKIRLINDDFPHENTSENKDAILASLSGKSLVYQKPTTTYEQVEPFDSNVFIDNFGTILFLDEDGEEVEVEQPYYVEYKVSLVELVDSLYAKLNGDADEVATKTELVEGDVVPAQAVETEKVAPYSEQSGIHVDGAFKFQTSGGDAECSDLARIECIKGTSIKIVSMPLHITNQKQEYESNNFYNKSLLFNDEDADESIGDDGLSNIFSLTAVGCLSLGKTDHYYAVSFDAKVTASMVIRDDFEYDSGDYIKLFGQNISNVLSTEFKHFFVVKKGNEFNNFLRNTPNNNIFGRMDISNGIIYDLTEMFGKGFEPKTEKDFRLFYPYDNFETINTSLSLTPRKLISRGYNAFDGEFLDYAVGQDDLNEEVYNDDDKATSLISVLPGTQYGIICNKNIPLGDNLFEFGVNINQLPTIKQFYCNANKVKTITTGKNTHFLRLNVPKDVTKLTIFVYWDGTKQVQEASKIKEYDFPATSLSGINKFRDEWYPDGTIKRYTKYIDYHELSYNFLINGQRILSDTKFYLTLQDLDVMLSPKQTGVDSIDELEFKVIGGTFEIVEQNGELCLQIETSNLDASDWESSGYVEIEILIGSPVPFDTTKSENFKYASDIWIDNWGTTEWVYIQSHEKYFTPVHCVINYVGDYVAFMDTLANREDVQYDAHQLLTKGDENIAQFFDDKDFIINGKKMCSDPVRVLISPVEKSIKPHRKLRNGSTRSLHPHDYIGKKKFNYITDFYFEDIETLIQDFYGVSNLVYKKLYDFFSEEGINYNQNKDIVFNGDARLYGSEVYIAQVDVDYISNEEFHSGGIEYVLNATPSEWFEEISECGFPYEKVFMSDDDKRIKIHKVYKNRIFKFVRNFEFANKTAVLGWKGIMANEGIEMEVYVMSDYRDDAVYLIFRPKKIILK